MDADGDPVLRQCLALGVECEPPAILGRGAEQGDHAKHCTSFTQLLGQFLPGAGGQYDFVDRQQVRTQGRLLAGLVQEGVEGGLFEACLLYTSDAADE